MSSRYIYPGVVRTLVDQDNCLTVSVKAPEKRAHVNQVVGNQPTSLEVAANGLRVADEIRDPEGNTNQTIGVADLSTLRGIWIYKVPSQGSSEVRSGRWRCAQCGDRCVNKSQGPNARSFQLLICI
jgi:hypothetical protein